MEAGRVIRGILIAVSGGYATLAVARSEPLTARGSYPGKLNIGIARAGSAGHIASEFFIWLTI